MKTSARRLSAMLIAAGALTVLAACTPPVTNLAGCAAPYQPGDNSDAVTSTEKTGRDPEAQFPTPLVTKDAQVTVMERGDGPVVYPTNTVELHITTYDPKTGEALLTTGYSDVLRTVVDAGNYYAKYAQCVTAGSRIAVVTTAKELYGPQFEMASAQTGESEDDTELFVIDVVDTYLGKANGWDQLPQAEMPAVVLAPNGAPGILTPKQDPPKDFRLSVLKAGAGDTVADGDSVVVQYTGIVWGKDDPFDSTWSLGKSPAVFATTDVVEGFAKALIGQRVGSQVLAVIPPELGYGDREQSSIPAGSTLIFVVDILKIQD